MVVQDHIRVALRIAFFLAMALACCIPITPASTARAESHVTSSIIAAKQALHNTRFLYVGCPQSKTLLIFSVDKEGVLCSVSTVLSKPLSESSNGFSDPWRPTAPMVIGRLIYSIDGDSLFQFRVNDVGLPQPLTPSTICLSNSPFCLTLSPDMSSVYALHYEPGNIIHLMPQSDGSMTRLPDVVRVGGFPNRIIIDPADRFAYVSVDGTTQTICYRIEGDGVLDADSSRTFTMAERGFQDEGGSSLITFTPDGKYAYDVSKYMIFQYRVMPNGEFKALSSQAVVRDIETYFSLVIAPDGRCAYAVNSDNSITEFRIGEDGRLFAIGSLPATPLWHAYKGYRAILIDSASQFAYVTSPQQHTVVRYRVANDGQLTAPLAVVVPEKLIPETLAMVQE